MVSTNFDDYPAQVISLLDMHAIVCGNPHCLMVTQRVCLVYEYLANDEDGDEAVATLEAAFRQALRDAIKTGTLLQQVPAQHLP